MAELLHPMVCDHGAEPAIIDDTGSCTWRELDEQVDRWRAALYGAGLERGDRVAFVLGNRRETYQALLACLHTGVTAVPVNWRLTAPEMAYILADSGSKGVITEAAFAATVADAISQAGTEVPLRASVDAGAAGFATLDELPAGEGDDCSGGVLLYTSGTSGRPKGVVTSVLSVGAPVSRVAASAAALGAAFDIPREGRALLVGPWYHSGQVFFSLYPLLLGCSLVMRHKFDAAETLRVIDQERITIAHLVPTQFIRMLKLPAQVRAGFDGSSLVRIWHGGSPCPREAKAAMIDWWGPVLVEYYAATESGIVTRIDSEAWLKRPGSVGRAKPPVEILIVGEDGEPLPAGQEGRVAIKPPPGRTFSYANAPEKTEAAYLSPGAFTVGDVGYLDDEGYLFLTARSVEIIVSGGVNIYPAEIEAVLLGHPAVRDAVAIGVPDEEFGEQVKALVELEPDTDQTGLAEALDAHCRAELAGFKVPRSYEFVPELPREPTGKVARRPLREPYWAAAGRRL